MDQLIYAKFSKKLKIGDVITYDIKYGQKFSVQQIMPSCRGYEVEGYELKLITEDKSELPETLPFKIGTLWQLVDMTKKGKFRVVSKRKQYYD